MDCHVTSPRTSPFWLIARSGLVREREKSHAPRSWIHFRNTARARHQRSIDGNIVLAARLSRQIQSLETVPSRHTASSIVIILSGDIGRAEKRPICRRCKTCRWNQLPAVALHWEDSHRSSSRSTRQRAATCYVRSWQYHSRNILLEEKPFANRRVRRPILSWKREMHAGRFGKNKSPERQRGRRRKEIIKFGKKAEKKERERERKCDDACTHLHSSQIRANTNRRLSSWVGRVDNCRITARGICRAIRKQERCFLNERLTLRIDESGRLDSDEWCTAERARASVALDARNESTQRDLTARRRVLSRERSLAILSGPAVEYTFWRIHRAHDQDRV